MRKHMTKRIGAILLSLVLVFGIAPTDIFAAEQNEITKTVETEVGEDLTDAVEATEKNAVEVIGVTEATESSETVTPVEDEKKTENEEDTSAMEAIAVMSLEGNTRTVAALPALSRVLVEDTFDNGNKWNVSSASIIKFENGMATIKGGGPHNCMGYKAGIIAADDFLIQLDVTPNSGNTNANTKIGFKAQNQYDGERLHVRIDWKNKVIYIEKANGNGLSEQRTEYKHITFAEAGFEGKIGTTYHVDIKVEGTKITLYIDGTEIMAAVNAEIGSMKQGLFSVIGQYPDQDFSIDNLKISTDEELKGSTYTVQTRVVTNDDTTNTTGGTLTLDKASGYAGESIELITEPASGYVFDHFEFLQKDSSGNEVSATNKVAVINNKITLSEAVGNVIAVAYFKTRVAGKEELSFDDFSGNTLSTNFKTVKDSAGVSLVNGKLELSVVSGMNYLLMNSELFSKIGTGDGYQISFDMKRKDATTGTHQIMFKGSDTAVGNRYVVLFNGGIIAIKKFVDGAGQNPNAKQIIFTDKLTTEMNIKIKVIGNTVTVYVNDVEKLSYTDPDGWDGRANAVGFFNMTPATTDVFDNLLVERIPEELPVESTVTYNDAEDVTGVYGSIVVGKTDDNNNFSVVASAHTGDTLTIQAMPKVGYQVKEYQVSYLKDQSTVTIPVNGTDFTIPAEVTGKISVVAVLEKIAVREAMNFYLDSEGGDDANAGTSEDAAWKTLDRLAAEKLSAGDHVYLKCGSNFNKQQLRFEGMGTKEAPIEITSYGDTNNGLPKLNGEGEIQNVVSLYNQEYINISNLEITNTSPKYLSTFERGNSNNKSLTLRAINVSAKNFGEVRGIHITNCYIHDINGNIDLKWNGGIFFDIQADVINGQLVGFETKYDDVLIENNTIINVDRSAVKLVSSSWCNQSLDNSPNVPIHWYPSTNVVLRNNYMYNIGGDGITTRDTDGALIEKNVAAYCQNQGVGYNVAIWTFESANTVIQYNEVANTQFQNDGQGLDCDHLSSNTVMQYNYSHDNQGGFMLVMGQWEQTAPTIRYNVSQNDMTYAFQFTRGIPKGTMIYNNTIYSDSVLERGDNSFAGIIWLSEVNGKCGVSDFYMFNNIFVYPEGQTDFYCGVSDRTKAAIHLFNNAYVGGIQAPDEEKKPITIADISEVFENAGKGPTNTDNHTAYTGKDAVEVLSGYNLKETSSLVNAGVSLDEFITAQKEKAGVSEEDLIETTTMSPADLFNANYPKNNSVEDTSTESILLARDYTTFPLTDKVTYDTDFFGGKITVGSACDLGAIELQEKKPNVNQGGNTNQGVGNNNQNGTNVNQGAGNNSSGNNSNQGAGNNNAGGNNNNQNAVNGNQSNPNAGRGNNNAGGRRNNATTVNEDVAEETNTDAVVEVAEETVPLSDGKAIISEEKSDETGAVNVQETMEAKTTGNHLTWAVVTAIIVLIASGAWMLVARKKHKM